MSFHKAIYLVVFSLAVLTVNSFSLNIGGDGNSGGLAIPTGWLVNILKKQMLAKLDMNVNAILSARAGRTADGKSTVYLWDILSPLERFLMLNQSQIQLMDWNVTASIIANTTRLQWSSLPSSAQSLLLVQINLSCLFKLLIND
jgi:hypothetical protein